MGFDTGYHDMPAGQEWFWKALPQPTAPQDWELVGTEEVEPFPEGYERLYILQRKNAKHGWLW